MAWGEKGPQAVNVRGFRAPHHRDEVAKRRCPEKTRSNCGAAPARPALARGLAPVVGRTLRTWEPAGKVPNRASEPAQGPRLPSAAWPPQDTCPSGRYNEGAS